MSKISVIIPVYKVEQYLDRCVESVLVQTFTDFELILVDDGSPDNCPKMCDDWAKKDKRVVVIHQQNGGLSAARNAGIDWVFANSNSEWITFIDSDDWVHPEYLQCLYDSVIHNNVLVSVCGFKRTSGESPNFNNDELMPVVWIPEDFYVEQNTNAVIACGKLISKSLLEDIRFPVGKIHEDEFTTHKLLFQCESIAVINAPLYAYFINENGIMGTGGSDHFKVEACSEKVSFFDELHFNKARDYAIDTLAYVLPKAITTSKSKKEVNKLRRMLRKILKRNRKRPEYSIKNKPWFYEAAYPYRMRIYWMTKALLKKFKLSKE